MTIAEESLAMHAEKRGKIEVVSTVETKTQKICRWPILRVLPSPVWRFRRMWRSPMYTRTAGTPVW